MDFKDRWDKVKQVTIKRPYLYSFIFIFIIYMTLNFFLNEVYVTLPVLLSFNLKVVIPFLILSPLIGILVAININLVYLKFKELKTLNRASGLSFFGMLGGILSGACPGCFVGLFPSFLGLFGITASLSSLPFNGLELQVGSVVLLTISIVFLTKPSTCKIEIGDEK